MNELEKNILTIVFENMDSDDVTLDLIETEFYQQGMGIASSDEIYATVQSLVRTQHLVYLTSDMYDISEKGMKELGYGKSGSLIVSDDNASAPTDEIALYDALLARFQLPASANANAILERVDALIADNERLKNTTLKFVWDSTSE